MLYKAPSSVMHYLTLIGTLLLILIFAPSAAQANTEKVIFTARHASSSNSASSSGTVASPRAESASVAKGYHGIVDPTHWKVLTSPHTIIRSEAVKPSFYEKDVTIAALRMRANPSMNVGQAKVQSELIQEAVGGGIDLQNREFRWYVLQGLDDGASYELRVSYPATSPADFELLIWTLNEAQEHVPKNVHLLDYFPKETMFVRIKATYTGISYRSTGNSESQSPETLPIPYNLVLEKLYFMIPYQALKLIAVIAVAVIVGLGFLVPRVHSGLLNMASGATENVNGKKTQ
ncbi:hypothetical protein BGX28_004933 [Mortierella sp. GBA30]|nr:hypothetical protein BGX28_004933 [Mortierella sp. GBA30]